MSEFPRYAGRRQRPDSRWAPPDPVAVDDAITGCNHLGLMVWDDERGRITRFGKAYLCCDCGQVLTRAEVEGHDGRGE